MSHLQTWGWIAFGAVVGAAFGACAWETAFACNYFSAMALFCHWIFE
jgi:hypothetical protein